MPSQPLPVPTLEDSTTQFLEAIEPIVQEESYLRTEKNVREFVSGKGKLLQNELLRYADELDGASWLMEYSRQRFLAYRAPLSTIGNFGIEFEKPTWIHTHNQVETAAKLAYSVGKLYAEIVSGRLPPLSEGRESLVQSQLSKVLGATRHPQKGMDSYEVYEPFREAHSFGMFFRGHYYFIRIFDEYGNLYSFNSIYKAIAQIVDQNPKPAFVNFHTAGFAGSEMCAQFLTEILSDNHNAVEYQKICHSIFHITLDNKPRDAYLPGHMMDFGCEGLWLYKPWSFAVYTDSSISSNNEHTAIDGISNVYLFERVFMFMEELPLASLCADAVPYEELVFNLTNKQQQILEGFKQQYQISYGAGNCMLYAREGVDWNLFRQNGIGRDALIQLGFIYAQFKLYGYFRFTHESVSTFHYNQGRTSCMRTVTPASVRAVQCLINRTKNEELLRSLASVSESHSRNIRRAKKNICFIRHSAGLRDIWSRNGKSLGISTLPSIFEDENYLRYCTQELSTSTIGSSKIINSFAFKQMVNDGLGLGYMSGENFFRTSVTWDNRRLPEGERFAEFLDEYFDLLEAVKKVCKNSFL